MSALEIGEILWDQSNSFMSSAPHRTQHRVNASQMALFSPLGDWPDSKELCPLFLESRGGLGAQVLGRAGHWSAVAGRPLTGFSQSRAAAGSRGGCNTNMSLAKKSKSTDFLEGTAIE